MVGTFKAGRPFFSLRATGKTDSTNAMEVFSTITVTIGENQAK